MPNGGYQDVVNKLETLKSQFVIRVVSELDQNVALIRSAAADHGGMDRIAKGYEWLHRLSGSAGTFGFSALGQQAKYLEERLQSVVESAPDDQLAALEQALDADFFTRLDSLKSLLRSDAGDSAIPVLQNAFVTPEPEPESLVRVDLIEPDEAVCEDLVEGLTRYGYEVIAFTSLEEFRSFEVSDSVAGGAAAMIADVALLEPLQRVLDDHEHLHRRLVVYLSRDDSFEMRYRVADTGAGGFFSFPVDVPSLADCIEQLSQEREESTGGKVMLVEDDEQLAEHYRIVLSAGGLDVLTVVEPQKIMAQLSEFRPDILLMDIKMAPYSGISLARMVRLQPEWLGLPIVYLSSEQDRDQQISAVAQGADDFIEKPITDQRLVSVIRARCVRARQLAKLASRDSLTGLMKHSLVKQELAKEFSRSHRYNQVASVAMLDLDHFKSVNDTYGHACGDTVIRALANLLRHRLRKSDILGRYGGEEFVVILPDCGPEEAQRILEDVCSQFSGLVFSHQGTDFSVTLSAGIATLSDFSSADAALNAADTAMYYRKKNGRNGVMHYADMKQDGTAIAPEAG